MSELKDEIKSEYSVRYRCRCGTESEAGSIKNHLHFEIFSLYVCKDCGRVCCKYCIVEEFLSGYCPSCSFDYPIGSANKYKGRCYRGCYQCPLCGYTIGDTTRGAYFSELQCPQCNWSITSKEGYQDTLFTESYKNRSHMEISESSNTTCIKKVDPFNIGYEVYNKICMLYKKHGISNIIDNSKTWHEETKSLFLSSSNDFPKQLNIERVKLRYLSSKKCPSCTRILIYPSYNNSCINFKQKEVAMLSFPILIDIIKYNRIFNQFSKKNKIPHRSYLPLVNIQNVVSRKTIDKDMLVFELKFTNATRYKLLIEVCEHKKPGMKTFTVDKLDYDEYTYGKAVKEMLFRTSSNIQIEINKENFREDTLEKQYYYPLEVTVKELKPYKSIDLSLYKEPLKPFEITSELWIIDNNTSVFL